MDTYFPQHFTVPIPISFGFLLPNLSLYSKNRIFWSLAAIRLVLESSSCLHPQVSNGVPTMNNRCSQEITSKGDLVVQGDVPVARFRVSNSSIYYLLRSKNFQIYYRSGFVKIDMMSSRRFKKV